MEDSWREERDGSTATQKRAIVGQRDDAVETGERAAREFAVAIG